LKEKKMTTRKKTTILVAALLLTLAAFVSPSTAQTLSCIDVEKVVDPEVAMVGDVVTYTICVTNCGDTIFIADIMDLTLGFIFLPIELVPGEELCVTFDYEIQPEDPDPLVNEVWVIGSDELGNIVEDFAEAVVDLVEEGCNPGFWKDNGDKHGASAWCERFSPSDPISMHFALNEDLVIRGKGKSTISDPTLLQALRANGGGVNAMIRHGIAAMLNACSDCVQYEYSSEDQVIMMIEDTLNGVGAYTIDELHSMFASYNEAGCPVNQHGDCVGVEEEI
jgi:hypothetical protein